jgi:hypothetical protein
MQLPLVAPAPVVSAHAAAFRNLFENPCQFQHFQHYLSCVLASADKTKLAT